MIMVRRAVVSLLLVSLILSSSIPVYASESDNSVNVNIVDEVDDSEIIAKDSKLKKSMFTDVNIDNEFYKDLTKAVERGYVSGYTDGTFRPDAYVTCGEFSKMVCNAFGVEVTDLPYEAGHWAYKYAAKAGLSNVDQVFKFASVLDDEITRAEAVKVLMNFLGVRNPVSHEYLETVYNDIEVLGNYSRYQDYIVNAYYIGLMGDCDGEFKPNSGLTRIEAVTIIEKALSLENIELPVPKVIKDNEDIVKFDGEIAETYKNDVASSINMIPNDLWETFRDAGGTITVYSDNFSKHITTSFKGDIKGCYFPNDVIYIFANNRSSSLAFCIVDTFLHEFGHYVYYKCLSDDDREVVDRLYENEDLLAEVSSFTGHEYCTKSVSEFFAELFYSTIRKQHYTNTSFGTGWFTEAEELLSSISSDFVDMVEARRPYEEKYLAQKKK